MTIPLHSPLAATTCADSAHGPSGAGRATNGPAGADGSTATAVSNGERRKWQWKCSPP